MIDVKGVSVAAGKFSLHDVSLCVPTGTYGVLMGRTGCGKTTLMEIVCGLRGLDTGTVRLMGRDVTFLKPAERGVGYVPQDGALFRTMSVADNLSFALRVRRWGRAETRKRVDELADLLGLGHLLKRTPAGLSGGEAQRVALGRALAFRPDILCLDEPLSSLDEETWGEMCELLKEVQQQSGVTILHVTHNRRECRLLADDLFRFTDGRIEEMALDA